MSATWFGVLGTLAARHGDRDLKIPAAKQRIVLATLLVSANRPVPVDALADAIWPAAPSPSAAATVRNYVLRLRHVLGPAGLRILTRAPGYLIEIASGELDALVFEELSSQGSAAARTGNWALARERLGAALALWRGAPLADVPSAALHREEVPRLELLRSCATEWRVEADLHLGLHAELVPELQRLVTEHPLSERFHAQLMLALYRSGRRGDALAAFARTRRILRDELGLEPGPELAELQGRILSGDPALAVPPARTAATPAGPVARQTAPRSAGSAARPATAAVVPRQLPYRVPHFVGRLAELEALQRMTGAARDAAASAGIVAIDGTAGVGKSALAVHWGHEIAGRYPDGQLYVNLRGFDDAAAPMDPATAIRRFLDALQVPAWQVPASLDSQAGLYRSLVSDLRLLILLDNARDADQVRPLLPGGSGSLILVTSRTDLTSLAAAEGAHHVKLDVLADDDARMLVERRLGSDRLAAEPAAAAALIELCARLPIALSIAAAIAAGRPHIAVADHVEGLLSARARLDALTTGEASTDVRAVLSWSYRSLRPPAQRMFRLLGIHPGPDISLPAAASLAAVSAGSASLLLQELTRAHMLAERLRGRYSVHDLLRAYATEQARRHDSAAQSRAARCRMLDHYLHTAHRADELIRPVRMPIALSSPVPGVVPERLRDYGEALAWFQAEHAVILGAAVLAGRGKPDARAWQLPWAIAGYLDLSGHWADWAATQQAALHAVSRCADLPAQAHVRRGLGCALTALQRYDDARSQLELAQSLYQRSGDIAAQGRTCVNIAHAFDRQHRHDEALAWARKALDCARNSDDQAGVANALNAVGMCNLQLKRYRETLVACEDARRILRGFGYLRAEACTWDTAGIALQELGDYERAVASYSRAAEMFLEVDDRQRQAESVAHIGDAYLDAGATEHAVSAWTRALSIVQDLDLADTGQMRAALSAKLGENRQPARPGSSAPAASQAVVTW